MNLTKAEHRHMKPNHQKSERAVERKRQYRRRQKTRKAELKACGGPRIFPLKRLQKYADSDRVKKSEAQERQDWLTHRKQERRWLEDEIMPNKSFGVSKHLKAAFIQITRFEYEEERSNALCDDNDRVSQFVKDLFIMVNRERGRARAEQGIASHTEPVKDWWGPGKPPIDHRAVLKDNSMDDKYLTRLQAPKEPDWLYDWITLPYQDLGKGRFMDSEEWLHEAFLSREPLSKFGPLLPGITDTEFQISTVETAEWSDSTSGEARSEERRREHMEVAGVEEEAAGIMDMDSGAEEAETEVAMREGWTWRSESMEETGLEEFEMDEAAVEEEVSGAEEGETPLATREGWTWRWLSTGETGLERFETNEVDEQPRTPEAQIIPDYYT